VLLGPLLDRGAVGVGVVPAAVAIHAFLEIGIFAIWAKGHVMPPLTGPPDSIANMTNAQAATSERVVQTVQELRKHRRWTVSRLAEECARHGHPEITDQVIYNLEQRRRETVTVDQLMAFSKALSVPTAVLLAPASTGSYVLWFESEAEQRMIGEALQALSFMVRKTARLTS